MREFHFGPYMTQVADGEILTEVRFPIRPGAGSAYEKVERRVGDWAVAAVGRLRRRRRRHDHRLRHRRSRAVGPSTSLAPDAEEFLHRQGADRGEPRAAAAQMAADSCNPVSDQRGPADYKRHLAKRAHSPSAAPLRRRAEPGSLTCRSR